MSLTPGPLAALIERLVRLPGIGPKSAQRLAFHLLKVPREEAAALAEAVLELKNKIRACGQCFNISEEDRCAICQDGRRDAGLLCVVEEVNDLLAIEKTREFRGLYHVLGGSLSPLDGRGPEQIRGRELLQRLEAGGVREVILATNPNVEGEAT
ncbi:MAG TPA: recombination mediator RecR, partial [Candidatus Sulfotelmatobacter sp.]|nr:recombination mediator RecR [Candidatus Sulfotelmatobacter sp.]